MATLEERVQALEREHEQLQTLKQEHTELKKTIELQTIAIRALVAKEVFEKLQDAVEKSQEQNSKLFDTLITHDRFSNEQLAELRTQQIELDGKIVGLQTEMRQRFNEQDSRITGLDNKVAALDSKVTGLQTEIRQRFTENTTLLQQIIKHLSE